MNNDNDQAFPFWNGYGGVRGMNKNEFYSAIALHALASNPHNQDLKPCELAKNALLIGNAMYDESLKQKKNT